MGNIDMQKQAMDDDDDATQPRIWQSTNAREPGDIHPRRHTVVLSPLAMTQNQKPKPVIFWLLSTVA